MRITLTLAAFSIAAFLPITAQAEVSDAGEAGTASVGDAGASAETQGGASNAGAAGSSAGKGGAGGSAGSSTGAGGRVPAVNLPDPGTDTTNSCTIAAPKSPLGTFGATLVLGAAFLALRRRRPR